MESTDTDHNLFVSGFHGLHVFLKYIQLQNRLLRFARLRDGERTRYKTLLELWQLLNAVM